MSNVLPFPQVCATQTPKNQAGITFGELFNLYYQQHVLTRTKCHSNAHYWFTAHGPRWKDFLVESIQQSDVQQWCDQLGMHSTSSATRAVEMLSVVINWGMKRGYVPVGLNPCRHVEKFKIKSRERFLSKE